MPSWSFARVREFWDGVPTPPARQFIVSSEVGMENKVTPHTWLFAELKNRGHSEKIMRILQEE